MPESMAELTIKYNFGADSLLLKDLFHERDFLAQHLGLPRHLLQVISWGNGSIVITYWMVRDVLPLAELALCREDVRAALTQHGVEDIYLGTHPSGHSGLVRFGNGSLHCVCYFIARHPPSIQVNQSLQTAHCKETQNTPVIYYYLPVPLVATCMIVLCEHACPFSYLSLHVFVCYVVQRRAIVTVLDAHRQDLDVTSLISDLKGVLTAEQYQKLTTLNDEERKHEALLYYILLVHDGPDAYCKIVKCVGLRDNSIAEECEGVLDHVY